MARRCWKHSRQKTGRPWVGRKGTVVSLPHCEQLVLVSARTGVEDPPVASARLALQDLQRLGSFLNPLSAKNICSPAVNTNSAPHSAHFRTLSWYSMEAFPLTPSNGGNAQILLRRTLKKCRNLKGSVHAFPSVQKAISGWARRTLQNELPTASSRAPGHKLPRTDLRP